MTNITSQKLSANKVGLIITAAFVVLAVIVVAIVLLVQPKTQTVVAPSITYHAPYVGSLNMDYNWDIDSTAGSPHAVYTISAGHLPPGLELGRKYPHVTGTALKTGSYTFTVKADNRKSNPVTQQYTIRVTR